MAAFTTSITPPIGIANTVALLGDSITAYNYSGTSGKYPPDTVTDGGTNAAGYFTWANALLGNPFNVVYYGGVSGERSIEILARADTVLGSGCKWLFELSGTNDIGQIANPPYSGSYPACEAGIIANRVALWNKAKALGVKVVALAIPPVLAGQGWSLPNRNLVQRVNRQLKDLAQVSTNVIWVDTHAAMVLTSDANGYGVTGYYSDNIHPNAAGGYQMGKAIAAALTGLVKPYNGLVSSQVDCIQSDTSSKNLLQASIGLFQGSVAATAPVTGTVATNVNVLRNSGTATIASSQVASPDGVGLAQHLVFTGVANDQVQVQLGVAGYLAPSATDFPPGSKGYFECAIKVSGATNFAYPTMDCRLNHNLGTVFTTGFDTTISGVAVGTGSDSYTLVMRSGVFQLPLGATINYVRAFINMYLTGIGGATVDIYRASVVKL